MFATVITAAAAFTASINLTALTVVVVLAAIYVPLLAVNRQRCAEWVLVNLTIRQGFHLACAMLALSLAYIALVWYFTNWQTVAVWIVIEYSFNLIVSKIMAKRDSKVVLA